MKAKKSLGQHFLTSRAVIVKMLSASDVSARDTILEIGPGKGVLTRALLQSGARVIAVEKDERMIDVLHTTFPDEIKSGQLQIHHLDILKTDLPSVGISPTTSYKLIANIPYYITGEIIQTFLSHEHQPELMTLLIQKEVANRIAKDQKESILSLSVKAYGTPRYVMSVSKSKFNPPPKVDSAVITIADISKNNFKTISEKAFFTCVKQGFKHKRKRALKNLSDHYDKQTLIATFESLNIPATARAEDIPLSTWLKLTSQLH